MFKTFYVLSFLLMAHFGSFAQNSINDYKYIVVPSQFEFLKEKDQYQINSLTKFLFNKYGYMAYMQEDDMPDDLYNNRCLGLTADLVNDSSLFKTKLRIDLKDCNGNVVQSSQVGESREKEYAKAYNLALRDAFTTFQNMDYSYQPNEAIASKSVATNKLNISEESEEIAKLKQEINTLKQEKTETIVTEKPKEANVAAKPGMEPTVAESNAPVLYAQAIKNGFQIVDSTPKVIMVLYPTGAKDVFTVKDKNAIVFKKDGQWVYSENDGTSVKENILNIKF